jgi:hypothetical protein
MNCAVKADEMEANLVQSGPSWPALGLGTIATLFGSIGSLSAGVILAVRRSEINSASNSATVACRALAYSTVSDLPDNYLYIYICRLLLVFREL